MPSSELFNEKLISYIRKSFNNTADLIVREMQWSKQSIIICYYSTVVDKALMNEQLTFIEKHWSQEDHFGETFISNVEAFRMETLRDKVTKGNAVVIFPSENLMMSLEMQKVAVRSPSEPANEQVVRGSHEGFVESIDMNISLLRKKVFTSDLVVKNFMVGDLVKTNVTIIYMHTIAEQDVIQLVEKKINLIKSDTMTSPGLLEDYLEEHVWSPFPQLLNTERPDRVIANLQEGKVAILIDSSPTALIGPATFFSFYQTIDDFNSRSLIGSFYRLLRILGFGIAVLLPSFYIAVVSYNPEILPIELSRQIKQVVNEIPYRPIFEALILELMIEMIREAGIRLPAPIGQTIGIVGGLVIGDAIANAGLVSNVMIIVVALTALASFTIPSAEMNTAIRLLRFPFMAAASIFGFFGIAIGSLLLYIHLLNLSSLKQPYLSPFIPFQPKEFAKVFSRMPFVKPKRQTDNYKMPMDQEDKHI
ncbi:spore germination protein [Chungangia koreensis]|uniref:Spore germination protein n=1 Tax=Chungangia koreensis TaxID=752657 RepID=A0ABV8X5U9_9LACT